MFNRILPIIAGVSLTLTSGIAQAIAVTDVSFRIEPDPYQNANSAILLAGNDNQSGVNSLGGEFAGDPWVLLDKSDESPTVFEGVEFNVTTSAGTSGVWEMNWSGPGLPIAMDLVFVVKAARNWGAYLFEGIQFQTSPSSGDGTFEISWLNPGGRIPNISHASIYGRVSDTIIVLPPEEPPVPVPATPLLIALGLLLARRQLNKA